MASIPLYLKTLNIIENNKRRYYSSFFNDRQSIFGFVNYSSAEKYSDFLNGYQQKYGILPRINSDLFDKFKINSESLKEVQINVNTQETEELIANCASAHLGLVIVHSIQFEDFPDRVDITLQAQQIDIDYPELTPIHSLESLFLN